MILLYNKKQKKGNIVNNKIDFFIKKDEKIICKAKTDVFYYAIKKCLFPLHFFMIAIALTIITQLTQINSQLLVNVDLYLVKKIELIIGITVCGLLFLWTFLILFFTIKNAKKYNFVLTDKRIIIITNNKKNQFVSHYFSETNQLVVSKSPAFKTTKNSTFELNISYKNKYNMTTNIHTFPIKNAEQIASQILEQSKKDT